MISLCQTDLFDKLPNRGEKYKMLEALREAAAGKMYLEREYSEATVKLCQFLE